MSDYINDATLSQLAEKLETEQQMWGNEVDDATLSQLLDTISPSDCSLKVSFDLGFDELFTYLSPAKKSEMGRFAAPSSLNEMSKLITDTDSKNTKKATVWAMKIFNEWRESRNDMTEIPLLETMTAEEMNTMLSHFVMEIRKKDGSEYPANSVYSVMTGVLRHLNCFTIFF
jgi:hypothetical protein